MASNESFGGGTKTFTGPRLCAAIVDRLTFSGTIIETGSESYRLAQTKAKQQANREKQPVGPDRQPCG
ncbi:ATP-binding protein [Streptomyces sp. NPDC087843]|uniref:ATP-binding protein n=1 Tax=Streptomyces sp. NPDC087843 TaxID=3365804 RepID=UPI00380697CA